MREGCFRIESTLRFLTTEEGGRRGHAASGYRPNCWFGAMRDGEKTYNDCAIQFVDGETVERDGSLWVAPGGYCRAHLYPFLPQFIRDLLVPGMDFDVCEGHRVVATGRLVAVFDPGPDHDPPWPFVRGASTRRSGGDGAHSG